MDAIETFRAETVEVARLKAFGADVREREADLERRGLALLAHELAAFAENYRHLQLTMFAAAGAAGRRN